MAEDWRRQRERSTPLMLRVIVTLAAHAPRRLVRALLYPIVAYFLATSSRARQASAQYLRRALGCEPTWRDHWRHFFCFASCTLDRIFLLSGNASRIHVDASWSAGIEPIVANKQGCILIVAHFGSAEVLRFTPAPAVAEPSQGVDEALAARDLSASDFVQERSRRVATTILLDRRQGKMLTELLERLNPNLALDVIDASDRGPQLALKLKEALQAGRMVCLMADRVADGESFVTVDFLGGRARFAISPWLLAGALRAPVILGFGMHLGGDRYRSRFELFAENIALPAQNRKEAIAAYAQRYAQRLEHYVRQAPYNWFNFYDYWQHESPQP